MQEIHKVDRNHFPSFFSSLHHIPQPPKEMYYEGVLPNRDESTQILAIVGSRKHTRYGKEVVQTLIHSLASQPVVIVSGLALGIDSIAHQTAIDANLTTIAVPGSGIAYPHIYPRIHKDLAKTIVAKGGALVSEFTPETKAAPWTFPQRNRIMAGLCDAVLVIEAEEKSGTLITARLALEYNKTVLAVPGNINSPASSGTNWLIRQGATPITKSNDLHEALHLSHSTGPANEQKLPLEHLSPEELCIFTLLEEPKSKDDLIRESGLSTSQALIALTSLELKDLIHEEMSLYTRINNY